MGKYDQVLAEKDLKSVLSVTPRNERVQLLMDEIKKATPDLSDLAYEYAMSRKQKDELDGQLSVIQERLDALKYLLIPTFEEKELSSVKLAATGQTVSIQREPYARVTDKEAYRKWCIKNDMENEMSLPWQTTNALTKEALLQGLAEPDGVEAFVLEKLVLRKK